MKLIYLFFFVLLYQGSGIQRPDPVDRIAELIRQGNIHELSKMFAQNIEMTTPDQEDVYSTAQAEQILDKFFDRNRPRSAKVLHKVYSNPYYRFGVLIVGTDKGPYRLACTLKVVDKNLEMIELRIEPEKVK